jgi:hypothetical protein
LLQGIWLYYDKPIVAKGLSGPYGLLHIALIVLMPIIVAISIIVVISINMALLEIIFGMILRLSVDRVAFMALTFHQIL